MRTSFVALMVAVVLALSAGPVWAHAQLAQKSVPAGTEQRLTVRAFSERAGHYNAKVEVQVPAGFQALDCVKKANWDCRIVRSGSLPVVTFTRTDGVDVFIDDTWDFDVKAATTPGVYLFKTIQT
ncbi:MAG TPA: DUF1775 domain-containing protein, partial [Egibacteraceae bacterium]|nr:DUF1775 domain-containing protein [Egibacteraceae bacterium]